MKHEAEAPARGVDVEQFSQLNPSHSPVLSNFARHAFAMHGPSPRRLSVTGPSCEYVTDARFAAPDPRDAHTFDGDTLVEYGAVCVACLCAPAALGLRAGRVSKRGDKMDYFLEDATGKEVAVLEVKGTNNGSLEARLKEALAQVGESRWRRRPFSKEGFGAAVRFAEPAGAAFARYELSRGGA